MDKNIEEQLRRHIADEEIHQKEVLDRLAENAEAILGLINEMGVVKSTAEANREAIRPWNEFAVSMEQIGRVGRIVRAIVGWFILALSGVALTYVAFTNNSD